jgi:hypothetical protein
MNLALTRFAYLPDCTLGWLMAGGLKLATIERPWFPNPKGIGGMPRVSCVPDGLYNVRPHTSDKFPDTYALVNQALGVYYQPGDIPAGQQWGRSAILIHAGNTVTDVIGCIAVGTSHSDDLASHSVKDSRAALNQFRAVLGRSNAILQIRPSAGTQEAA